LPGKQHGGQSIAVTRGIQGCARNIVGDFNQTAPLNVDQVGANQFRDDRMIDGSREHRLSLAAEDRYPNPWANCETEMMHPA